MLRRSRLGLCAAVVALVLAAPSPLAAAPSAVSGDGERLLGPNGRPAFVIGLNYQGPADRAWEMWDEGKFDPALVDADFQRAAAAGATALRLFVQASLARDVAAGRWEKLDRVVALAEQRGLQLIVSLHDYADADLARVSATAGRIAERYRGRPGILAYDLKNEPRFGDLALARYAAAVPLQQRGLLDAYGERLPRDQVAAFRAAEQGSKEVPRTLDDDQAWLYVNNLRLYRELLADASVWVREKGFRVTSLDYLEDPAGAKWRPFLDGMNATLAAWLQPQVDALRRGDRGATITVGHVDAILARLPANTVLDYHTLHRYPSPGASSVRATLALVRALQAADPGRPHLLGEFGYATDQLAPERAALHEVAIFLGLLSQRAAGGAKWMLNDMPEGYNMRERTLGAFGRDGSPKPVVAALAALRAYLDASGSPPGELRLEDDADAGLRFVYRAEDALFLGGRAGEEGGARFSAAGPAQLFLTWSEPGLVHLWASAPMRVELDLARLLGSKPAGDPRLSALRDGNEQSVALAAGQGTSLSLALDGGGSFLLRLPVPARPADYDIPGGHFFSQTNGRPTGSSAAGFRVTNDEGAPFWDAFLARGGADGLGYPVSRRFQHDGFTVQAFQKGVLQWRPDQDGRVWLLNTFDMLHDRGKDDWLEVYRQVPRPFDSAPDAGLPWDRVVARHLGLLGAVPAPLRQRFLGEPGWLDTYGLPVATAEYATSVVVRGQRAAFQYWKVDVPWARRGDITQVNGGDLAKEAGVWPWLAVTPENAPR